ncbi:MAG: diacylglycerol kinase [Candidatus Peribacteria bacterium]|nr:diacylglycerol kinase [Candidatus Peribacteria bacterium]
MIISLVAAASENNIIGDSSAPNHAIPWNLPNDMQYFRAVTKGKPVIMGRKTLEFIGRALPGRKNIVITRQSGFTFPGIDVTDSLEKALTLARESEPEEVCVIGGGEIYRQALPLADRVYLTRVHAEIDGDTTFPELPDAEWKEISREEHQQDEQHAYAYTFLQYERIAE